LGRESVSTFYYAIEETYHIPEADFPKRPEAVSISLEKIPGEAGFSTLKRAILIEICSTFKISETHLDITGSIELARKNYFREAINPEIFDS
jgi:hypothetical protein